VAAAARTADAVALQSAARTGRSSAMFEAIALGHVQAHERGTSPNLRQDPLRQLAFSDLSLGEYATYIDAVRIVSNSARAATAAASGIRMYREMTFSLLDGESRTAEGELRIHDRLTDPSRAGRDRLPRTFTTEDIVDACNGFYKPLLTQELATFLPNARFRARLDQVHESLSANQCLVRLGRHSHFEAMTIPGFAEPPARGAGKTRSYANGAFPLGWARVTFDPS
jgi:hypothetical protein